jgi:hypothetical protein
MKTIQQNLTVGKANQGMDMIATVSLDGKPLKRFRCESMVGNFALYLHGQFHGGYTRRPTLGYNGTNYEEISGLVYDGIEGTIRIRNTWNNGFNSNWSNSGEDYVYIYGVTGDLAYLNGYWRVVQHNSTWGRLYHMDGSEVELVGDWNSSGYFRRVNITNCDRHGVEAREFQSWWPIVGADNTPVKVTDMWLASMIRHGSGPGELNHGTRAVSALATDKPSSRFVVTRSFTNQTEGDITVREIGLASDYSTANFPARAKILLARDTMDEGIIVPPNKTLTVDYEVIIELTPDTQDTDAEGTNGGLLQNFMSRLRTIASDTDIHRPHTFNMAAPGGTASANPHANYQGYQFGIQVGRDNTFVSMTDNILLDQILHGDRGSVGDQGPQLWYHGMDFSEVSMDEVANKATFSMRRLFENKSDEPVTIKEIGLRGNWPNNNSFSSHRQYARTALHPDDQVTVQPGQFALVEYVVEVIV